MTDANQIDDLFREVAEHEPSSLTVPQLRVLLQRQANIIVETGTGGRGFKEVDPEYKKAARALNSNFARLGLEPPFPWMSLWEWHGFYSTNLGSYQERRVHLRDLTTAALAALTSVENVVTVHDPAPVGESPSWERINLRVTALIKEYSSAGDRDVWQDVGRRSREILIDLATLIADPHIVPEGTAAPKGADAKAWFDLLLASKASGRNKAELRGMLRATWDLAQKVTHGDIDDVDAFAAAQATVLLIRTTQKLLEDD